MLYGSKYDAAGKLPPGNRTAVERASGYVAELIRAANRVPALNDLQKLRLAERAATMASDIHDEVLEPQAGCLKESVLGLDAAILELGIGKKNNEQIRCSLLETAGAIRTLRIELTRTPKPAKI